MQTCSTCGAVYADITGIYCPVCHGAQVIDFGGAKRKRAHKEEQRLERKVIERWTGKDDERE